MISRSYAIPVSISRLKASSLSSLATSYQQAMDSILNYPLYDAIVQGFAIPGPGNLSGLATVMGQIQNNFKVLPSSHCDSGG